MVAAGRGERLGEQTPKAFVPVGGRTPLWHTVQAIAAAEVIDHVVAVVPAGREAAVEAELTSVLPAVSGASLRVVAGGPTRQQSVAHGLAALPTEADVVLVHDAARFLTPPSLFVEVVAEVAAGHVAVVPGLPVVDTLKEVDDSAQVVATPDRSRLRAVQTPQGFRRRTLEDAHRAAVERGDLDATDDAGLVERVDGVVYVVPGHEEAFKVTRPLDLRLAEALLARRGVAS